VQNCIQDVIRHKRIQVIPQLVEDVSEDVSVVHNSINYYEQQIQELTRLCDELDVPTWIY